MPRTLIHVLLSVLLLAAQLAANAHALTHLESKRPAAHGKQLPHGQVCHQCALSAQLGTGLLGAPVLPVDRAAEAFVFAPPTSQRAGTPIRWFMSRAPPALRCIDFR